MKKRIHILSTVNAANVSKSGDEYVIRDVCGATDGIVMNGRMYPGDQLAAGAPSLDGRPAPAGHPKNKAGHYISATNGEALAHAWIGSYCQNARHTAGRTLVDIVVNEKQAKAHAKGAALVARLDAAINGTDTDPIHVSTGLNGDFVKASGESMGRKYSSIVTNIQYDHLAILIDEKGAGTPEQGVGMFLNSAGAVEDIETATLDLYPVDRRSEGLIGWVRKLLGNSELSFDEIEDGIESMLPEGSWLREIFSKYLIWSDMAGNLFRQDYAVGSDNKISLTSNPVPVVRKVEYKAVEATNSNPEKGNEAVKTHILAALNKAGISADGLDDAQLLTAYNALMIKPTADKLVSVNQELDTIKQAQATAAAAELDALAGKLAVNSSLTAADLKALGLQRLKELSASAAPVLVNNKTPAVGDEFAAYSLNSHLTDEGAK